MRRILILIFFVTIARLNFAQIGNNQYWYSGDVLLTNGNVVKGEISLAAKMDIIRVKQDNTIKAFTPTNVQSFSRFDTRYNLNRDYFSLPIPESSHFKLQFYELVHEGQVALLCRTLEIDHEEAENSSRYYYDNDPHTNRVKVDEFYLMKPAGAITKISKASELIDFLDQTDLLKAYIEDKKLDLSKRSDFLKLMLYYDSLKVSS